MVVSTVPQLQIGFKVSWQLWLNYEIEGDPILALAL